MDLLYAFRDFITKEKLFSPGDRLLLAVSGGLDSVVLCELCVRAGLDFTIAHCNFQLRGAESDRDQQFVLQLGAGYNQEVLNRNFDTKAYAVAARLSIQEAARELRYAWFREILEDWKLDPTSAGRRNVLFTAHHLDDNIETLLMNFFKGTGIAGLRAMLPRQGEIMRPLLFADRARLRHFAIEQGLSWVEDSSNESDKYTRNFFRHQVIPLVQQAFPSALHNLADNLGRFREIELIYRQAVEQQMDNLLEFKGSEIHIPVLKLKKSTPLRSLVYEIFSAYGFSPQQTEGIISLLGSPSGKYLCSATHRILKNRNWLILSPLRAVDSGNILLEGADIKVPYEQGYIRVELLPVPDQFPPASSSASVAWLDAAQISFPLLLRKWRPGDYFYPLGMRKKKKLARFFIDNRLSLTDKEKIWVVEMDKKIIWIVGWRIDDRFRVTPSTRKLLKISRAD